MHEGLSENNTLSASEINEYSWDITRNDSGCQNLKAKQTGHGEEMWRTGCQDFKGKWGLEISALQKANNKLKLKHVNALGQPWPATFPTCCPVN